MGKILVMVSTYNGERYLEEQLNSVFGQKFVELDVLVRDDGSVDRTVDILRKYEKYDNFHWYQGKNVGACRSFLELLYKSGDYDFYSFCDQDDYWYEGKLAAAIEKLKQTETPSLYFGRKRLVDENGKVIRVESPVHQISYGAALLNGVAYGCTMVLNRAAVMLLREYYPTITSMHDVWAYRVISALGRVVYDKEVYIDYRQHGSNAVGAEKTMLTRIRIGLRDFSKRKNEHYRSDAARELYEAYYEKMGERQKKITRQLMMAPKSFSNRIGLIVNPDLKAQRLVEAVFLRVFIMFGWI